jgi:hypothetical protein
MKPGRPKPIGTAEEGLNEIPGRPMGTAEEDLDEILRAQAA